MQKIIHSYKLRLTNLSQSNRSLKLGKLSTRRDIDLKDLGFLEKDSPEELLRKIIGGKDIRLLNKLDPRLESANLADRRLNKIFREVKTLFEESGTYDLFVGYPFVEGKFIDETIVRCPVLLFPVRLVRNLSARPRWKLESIVEEPVVFNKTLFLAYEQFQQVRLKPEFWEDEVDRSTDWQQWMNDLYKKVKDYEIEMNFNPRLFDLQLSGFMDYTQEVMNAFRVGKLTFQSHAVLGIFPQSDSALLQDYEAIEATPGAFDLEGYFGQARLPVAGIGAEEKVEQKETQYIREEDRYFVTPVDQSQEEALLRIKQGDSLVIHGPPGTGKSQVIVNIIADAMAHGKKVLLVSQKRAALDVVYKRLGSLGLGRFAVLVHDYRHDRKGIYEKVRRQIADIDQFKKEINDFNITRWEMEYNQLSRKLDQLADQFESLYTALTSREEIGISTHDLYLSSDPKAERLPLKEVANQLDLSRMEALLEKVRAVYDYREILEPDYPWQDRMSFRHYTQDDRERIQALLEKAAEQVADLRVDFLPLAEHMGPELLNDSVNQQRVDQFYRIQAILATPQIRSDIEAIHKDELKPAFIRKKLDQMGEIQELMGEMVILKDFPWRLYSDLKTHTAHYTGLSRKAFRLINLKYLKARWFLKKILEAKGMKLVDLHVKALKKELKLFSRLHGHYSRTYEMDFFHDYPLLDTLDSKNRWLEKKENHFAAYLQVSGMSFLPDLQPSFSFGELEAGKWETSMEWMRKLSLFNKKLIEVTLDWKRYLSATQREKLLACIIQPVDLGPYLKRLKDSLAVDFQDLRQLDILLASLSVPESRTLEVLEESGTWEPEKAIEVDALIEKIRNSIYIYWIERQEANHPILEEVSSRGWPRKIEEYGQQFSDRREKVTELIRRRVKESIVGSIEYNRLGNPVTYRQIFHQVTKKRRIWPIRKLVKETWGAGLEELVPVWMASPESVAAIFPMEKGFFDMVVFDEASQCFVERAIPAILRGKQSVIAGDHQQLQPFDLYKVKYEDAESEFVEFEPALEVESILDLAKNTLGETKLTWHYRSQEEALINFSNHAFYEGKLQVIPPALHSPLNYPSLEWISVEGTWRNNRNEEEAYRIVELILDLVQRPDNPSIGVVTFNYHQQELIKDVLDIRLEKLANEDGDLYQKLLAALSRTDEEDFQGIFVKNIENVQGDERDIIVFSVAYARNESGKVAARFGLLNQRGGENRLNVAITRARQKIYVVCSFLPHELQVAGSAHKGPQFLKTYLQYVKAVSDGKQIEALHLLNMQNETDLTVEAPNPIADQLAGILREKGFHVERNYGDTTYKLDLVVKASPDSEAFLLGIECEGTHYFSGINSKEREVYRPGILKNRGWKWCRVWARNWWQDRDKEVEKILWLL